MTPTNEAAPVVEHNLELVENAAYHEAGHIVVAVVLGLRLQGYGIHIDKAGKGVSFYEFCDPQIDVCGSLKSDYVLSKGEHSINHFLLA
jgi:hypothetical protein